MGKAICSRCQREFDVEDGDYADLCPGCTAKIYAMRQQRTELTEKNEKVFNFFPKITGRISRVLDVAAQKTQCSKKQLIVISCAMVALYTFVGVVIARQHLPKPEPQKTEPDFRWAEKMMKEWAAEPHETPEYEQKKKKIIADLKRLNRDMTAIYNNWVGKNRTTFSGKLETLPVCEILENFGPESEFPYKFLPDCMDKNDLHSTQYKAVTLVSKFFKRYDSHIYRIYAEGEREYATEEQAKKPREIIYFTDLAIKALENPESVRELVNKEWDKWMAEPAGAN